MKTSYREGDWFAVPLREGGYAIGIVARANRDGVLLGYFFGPRRDAVPTLADVQGLLPGDAALVGKFGHLGLKQGKWLVLGRLDGWHRDLWPMPALVRYEELSGRSFKVFYDDDDPNRLIREEEILPGAAEQGPKDGLMGGNWSGGLGCPGVSVGELGEGVE
ncbi:Imm26 family immunity protein [Pseudofrankia sp. DC12]|uniref:Imm26 family immunity protein n=1 Tax=Pseudofrankia sp. DC12 TaxID=683315 RepID=UPI0018DC0793|nr:Imm26 family immunity protein [Pseudofrankia sp. DC12]